MAIIKSGNWGVLSGSFGQDVVFRSLDQKTVICQAPASFTKPMDSASVSRRTKFRFVVKLSAAILKLVSLHIMLKKKYSSKRIFSEVVKNTYEKVASSTLDMTAVVLAKDFGFIISGPELVLSASDAVLSGDPLGQTSGINADVEKKIAAEGVICLRNPKDPTDPPFQFIPVKSADQDLSLTAPLSFTLPIYGADVYEAAKYDDKKAIVTLITKDSNLNPVRASMTVCG
jgi:hypothetical protein